MALIRCPECEKEISDKAEKCPNCGYIINRATKRRMNKVLIVVVFVVLLIICVLFILPKFNPISSIFQFGSAEVQNDTKKTDIGSLSNPYKVGDTVTLTIYEVQGYNYATGVRTVANPTEIEICIETPLFESIGDINSKFPDGTVDNHLYLIGLAIECISTTGDSANLFQYQVHESMLTKDKQTVGDVLDKLGYSTNNETIKKYSAQLYMNTDIYEGQTTRILVGGYESRMGVNSIDELDLLKIDYFDKEGEYSSIYISLHE